MGYPDHPTVELPDAVPDLYTLAASASLDPAGIREELLAALAGGPARAGHLCVSSWAIDTTGRSALLVEHPRFGWMPPGGHIIAGETVDGAATRELLEETGTTPDSQHPLSVHGTMMPATPRGPAHMHWTFGVVSIVDAQQPLSGETGQRPRWWPLDEDLPGSFFGDNPLLLTFRDLLFSR